MTCRSGGKPHVHRYQECPACAGVAEYELTKPDEVVDCVACGFEIPLPEDFVVYVRFVLETMKRTRFINPLGRMEGITIEVVFTDESSPYPPPEDGFIAGLS